MAPARHMRYPRLFVYLLLLSSAKVRVYTGLAQQHHEVSPLRLRVAPPPATLCEMSIPVLFILGSKEFEGLLLRRQTWRLQRFRGGRRTQRSHHQGHHFQAPATSLRPPPRSGQRPLAPSVITAGPLLANTLSAREIVFIVKGAGAYLALIYLQTIEKNPGPPNSPFTEAQNTFLMQMCETISKNVTDKVNENLTQTITNALGEFSSRLATNEKQLKELLEVNATQHTRISQLERHIRRNNMVIFGVDKNIAPEAALIQIATERLGLAEAPDIECAYRIGKQTENRPILVKFYNQQDKHAIMSNVRLLKGTKIVIIDDLTPEEQAMRRTILSAARAARDKGISCKVRRTGLLVNENFIPAVELSNEAWMDEERSSAASAQPGKRPNAVIATPPGSQPSTSADFSMAAPANKKDKQSGNQSGRHNSRSSSRKRNQSK
jgi:hypothetical protein